jgi:hypothetical protein
MMVTQLRPTGNYLNQWMVSSHTDPDKEYKVSQTEDGDWKCSCPRWIFGKAPKQDCKHIIAIKVEEPVDTKRTSRRAAEAFARTRIEWTDARLSMGKSKKSPVPPTPSIPSEPVFLLQTRRSIQLVD